MSYTKGPWRWTDEYQARDLSDTWSLVGENGYGILSCDGKGNAPPEFSPQDAFLIAAAPELLEALEGMLECFHLAGSEYEFAAIDEARSAIAKAKGEVK